jgi:Ni2+-binding GTPase involved in maturation of urease and hydrogenase
LHTLSKIGDKRAWAWITRDMLHDTDDEVARTAWRVHLETVHAGHADVGEHHVRLQSLGQVHRLPPVLRLPTTSMSG